MIIKSCKCDFTGWLFSCSDSLINFTLLSTPQRKKKKTAGSLARRDLCLSFHDLCVCQSVSWSTRVFLTDRDRRVFLSPFPAVTLQIYDLRAAVSCQSHGFSLSRPLHEFKWYSLYYYRFSICYYAFIYAWKSGSL